MAEQILVAFFTKLQCEVFSLSNLKPGIGNCCGNSCNPKHYINHLINWCHLMCRFEHSPILSQALCINCDKPGQNFARHDFNREKKAASMRKKHFISLIRPSRVCLQFHLCKCTVPSKAPIRHTATMYVIGIFAALTHGGILCAIYSIKHSSPGITARRALHLSIPPSVINRLYFCCV